MGTPTRDLSVVIPARNEMFLAKTVENVLANIRADTEVIAVCDGSWPDPPLHDHPRLVVLHYTESIGQRAATNAGVRVSQAKYVMKLDAHCAVGEGFDAILMEDCQPDWTMVPGMYNLHAFDWVCHKCGDRSYQGTKPKVCNKCGAKDLLMDVVWEPRRNRHTVSWRFDNNLQFQYWRRHRRRRNVRRKQLIETMSFIGACMFLERKRYWELDGLDERHGSWGQFGTEIALKSWLSGGKLVTSTKTWFAHLFRTGNFAGFSGNGSGSWPYPITQREIDKARQYSRDFWFNEKWPKAKKTVSWLVEKFKPVPDWHEGAT